MLGAIAVVYVMTSERVRRHDRWKSTRRQRQERELSTSTSTLIEAQDKQAIHMPRAVVVEEKRDEANNRSRDERTLRLGNSNFQSYRVIVD